MRSLECDWDHQLIRLSNDLHVKGAFGIGGALIFGALIVLGALSVRGSVEAENSGHVVVAKAPERNPIETHDSDGDGIQDWEESLSQPHYKTIDTPTSTFSIDTTEAYTPPHTFTGKFSEAFFKDYLEGKMHGQDFKDPTAFIGTAVTAIEQNTKSMQHSRLEYTIVPSTEESVRLYGNNIGEINLRYPLETDNEMYILQKALEANDPKMLEDLSLIQSTYEHIVADLLQIPVPSDMVTQHTALLNAYEGVLADVKAMQLAFSDPLFSLARVKSYETDVKVLLQAFLDLRKIFETKEITFTNDEPGSLFYIFAS